MDMGTPCQIQHHPACTNSLKFAMKAGSAGLPTFHATRRRATIPRISSVQGYAYSKMEGRSAQGTLYMRRSEQKEAAASRIGVALYIFLRPILFRLIRSGVVTSHSWTNQRCRRPVEYCWKRASSTLQ